MSGIAIRYVDVYVLRRAGEAWECLTLRRAPGARCPGSWEGVHGHVEQEERPVATALRELREETGFEAERLYNLSRVESFYRHLTDDVALIPVFAAIVAAGSTPRLGGEHDRAEWCALDVAATRFAWPRSARAIADIQKLLAGVDVGALEDVLRVC